MRSAGQIPVWLVGQQGAVRQAFTFDSGHFQMELGRSGIFKEITRNFQSSRPFSIIGALFTEKAHHKRGSGLNIPFTEHQVIAVLKSVEAGRTVKDVCREAVISEASYYNWKAKFGGMEASDIKKMKDLEDENRRLKQMFADLSLECRALKEFIEKKL